MHVAPPLRFHRAQFEDCVDLTISRLGEPPRLADLGDKTGFLMISVKNPSFSNRLIERFCRFCERHLGEGVVVVVDTPYRINVQATGGDETARARELEKLGRIASDTHRRATRVVAKPRRVPLSLRSWDEVAAETPGWLVEEVRSAFEKGGRFRRDVLERTREVVSPAVPDGRLEDFAGFLVHEIPVLCDLYYGRGRDGIVDVYPGENPALLWNIERGAYADDLPHLSRLAGSGAGLTYVDFREKARADRRPDRRCDAHASGA